MQFEYTGELRQECATSARKRSLEWTLKSRGAFSGRPLAGVGWQDGLPCWP